MDENLVLVSSPTGEDNCILIYGNNPNRIKWACARFNTCSSASADVPCTAGAGSVWIKQSDMTRYLALKLVS